MLYTDAKRAAQVLRSLGYRSGSPDGLHKDGYIGSIAYAADGVKISGEKFTSVIGTLQKFSVQEELQDIRENGIREKELASDREETQPEDVLGYADDTGTLYAQFAREKVYDNLGNAVLQKYTDSPNGLRGSLRRWTWGMREAWLQRSCKTSGK